MNTPLKLKEESIKYNINKKGDVIITTCIIKLGNINKFDFAGKSIYWDLNIDYTGIGMTYCNPKDNYDETTGKKIAYSRAKLNAIGAIKQDMVRAYDERISLLRNQFTEGYTKLGKVSTSERRRLNNVINNLE